MKNNTTTTVINAITKLIVALTGLITTLSLIFPQVAAAFHWM